MPTAPPPSHDATFETIVFWERFKNEIIAALIIVVLAVIGFTGYRFYSDRQAAAASALLASAKSAQDYQQVIARYPNTPAGADAYLLLAESQRSEKKLAEANATLQVFITKNPNHEFVPVFFANNRKRPAGEVTYATDAGILSSTSVPDSCRLEISR